MNYYIFVEGPDDKRFISKLFSSLFCDPYIIEYSKLSTKKINDFINTINYMDDCGYIFIADADGKTVEERTQCILEKYHALNKEFLFIAQFEIESWYYAGASEELCKELRMKHFEFGTDALTKEMFYNKLPNKGERIYVMTQILDRFSFSLAIMRNKSFKTFYNMTKRESAAV